MNQSASLDPDLRQIDLDQMYGDAKVTLDLLTGADAGIDHYLDLKHDMEAELRAINAEMHAEYEEYHDPRTSGTTTAGGSEIQAAPGDPSSVMGRQSHGATDGGRLWSTLPAAAHLRRRAQRAARRSESRKRQRGNIRWSPIIE